MINCGGLNILIKLLLKDENDIQVKSLDSMRLLAMTQQIKSPKNKRIKSVRSLDTIVYTLPDKCKNVVTFILDDGSSVKADRNFLSENCEYFNRLLSGDFKESQEKEIVLKNTESSSLELLLILLYEGAMSKGLIQFNIDLNILLDAIVLADKLIMLDLLAFLTECVEQFLISSETVPVIYKWSIESGTNLLRIESIAFILVENMLLPERHLMFRKLFDLGYTQNLIDDIRKLFDRFIR